MIFSTVARYFQKLEQTASRLVMTEILAQLFHDVEADEISKLCLLMQGRVAPLYEPVEFGIADKFMIRAISLAFDKTIQQVESNFRTTGDLGSTAEALYQGKDHKYTVSEIYSKLVDLTQISGTGSQDEKIEKISMILKQIDSVSVRYITRIPLGKLRLGFSDMTVIDALSWMITGDKSLHDVFEAAYSVRPDIGWVAQTVKSKGIDGFKNTKVQFGVPILASLCQRLPTADEMIEKMGEVAVEPKYDGVRVQIHFRQHGSNSQKPLIHTFSRNLENTTEMFPELQDAGKQINAQEVILDCEAVGIDIVSGKILPFQETTTRKRKHNIEEARQSVPLRFFVFDILSKNSKDLLDTPLSERRNILQDTIKHGSLLSVSPQIITTDPQEIRSYHAVQLAHGLEGVIIKRWSSPYEPGRRGFSWVKFKEEEGKTGKLKDTIDAVVMGYYKGEGKRSEFGIGAFLVGIRNNEEFVTITKIGTGVTDDLWKSLLTQFRPLISKEKPKEYTDVDKMLHPDVWIEPEIVVEIAGDDLTKSPNHGAGYAIRFPRLIRVRSDKSPKDTTTIEEIHTLFQTQYNANV